VLLRQLKRLIGLPWINNVNNSACSFRIGGIYTFSPNQTIRSPNNGSTTLRIRLTRGHQEPDHHHVIITGRQENHDHDHDLDHDLDHDHQGNFDLDHQGNLDLDLDHQGNLDLYHQRNLDLYHQGNLDLGNHYLKFKPRSDRNRIEIEIGIVIVVEGAAVDVAEQGPVVGVVVVDITLYS